MKYIFTLLFLLACNYLLAQIDIREIFENKTEVYFRFEIADRSELDVLTNIISIDNVKNGKTVYAYANIHEFEEFLKLNYDFEILPNPSTLIQPEMSNNIEDISAWDVYPTYDAYVNLMNQFQSNYPQICKLIDAGNTVQGRKILFVKISDNVEQREPEPQFMYTSSMHGDELTGYVLMLRLIDSLLSSYGTDTRITNMINNAEIWINPLANPDGTYRSGNNTVSGATRYNFNNYDLNRNFPDPVNGINPNQQIEVTRFRTLQEANNFTLIANFHGGAEVVNYPWDTWANTGSNSRIHADQTWYQYISHLYADTCQAHSTAGYMSGFDDGTTNGGDWYVIHGGRQDYTNWYRHGREVTIEISNTKLPPASQLPSFWEYNKRSFLNYIEHIFYGINGIVTDTVGNPIRAKITIISHDYDSSEVYSDVTTGFYNRMIQPGIYTLKFQSPGYFDFITDPVQITSYTSSFTINVQMIPVVPIPVELSSFTATVTGNEVQLNWTTVTETNNKGFEVQRSVILGEKRNLYWESIGFVNGKGTSTEINNYSYNDKNLKSGKYSYRLKQIDYDGSFKYSDEIYVNIENLKTFSLEQNYPNPFNPSTKISWQSPVSSWQTLTVYDILGNEVTTLVDEYREAGIYEVEFDAENLSSGIYFYKLQAGNFIDTKKMILMR
ncbi:MAG: T9SS type A sorting domain-containing protein [Ignavibacterium sp.]|jgi:archaellum component FlaG (FlaF/FlaG flagellin family)|uniref:M14 family zinc carboxypeptidase n=1 Tax=Ignavibacterium sp. TaxID=2651167 RepID=UPI003296D66D